MLDIGKVETVKNEKVIMGVVWLKCYLMVTKIKNLFISMSGCVSFTNSFLIRLNTIGVAEHRFHLSLELTILALFSTRPPNYADFLCIK